MPRALAAGLTSSAGVPKVTVSKNLGFLVMAPSLEFRSPRLPNFLQDVIFYILLCFTNTVSKLNSAANSDQH